MSVAMVTGLLLAFGRPSARAKFDSMLTACTLSPKAIEFIDDKKMRILFHGVNAAAANEEIREAFEIVYEDLGPVRVAGDLIFGRLNRIASEANERSATLADIGDGDAALDALSTTRALFDVLDSDSSGRLDRDELLGSSELLALIRGSQPSDFSDEAAVDSFLCKADSDGDGQVSFLEFCLHCSSSAGEMADEAVQAALESAVMRRHESQSESTKPTAQRGRKMTTSERFDEMLTTCMEWEATLISSGCADDLNADECDVELNRFERVLKGTFVGGRTPAVADALRLCYEEYSPLRFGGDLIFSVLKRVVATKLKANK